ncbi:hypothetical protein AB2B41_07295 [Marimonas sp. MJW-29]|uniref:Uncharacterized protein n=1 Tax=Sulfitobacter sediminis TaxID=3234186 RepID=A0ABV3RKA5_9RHOB
MSAIPYNIARGAASSLQMSPPFAFSDVTMSVFPLRASLSRLETFCTNYLNQAPHLVQFKPFVPFVYLVILDYGRMSLQAANMGWVSQREVAFGIPLRWLNVTPEGPVFHDWAFTSPFIFVDNEMSMSTGREVYGWPKLLAKLDPSVSEWVRDPHGARRVFQVSTKRAAHAYAGEMQAYRPFLSVYQHRAAGIFDIPPSMDTITKPLQQLSSNVAGFTRLGTDLLRTFAGMASDGITGEPVLPDFLDQGTFRDQLRPERLKSWVNPKDWLPGLRDMLWSMFPRTYANTINFKQFRDAGDPHATCYQAITSAKMPVKSIARGGLLGPQNMLLGQLDGGFRIDVHSLAGLPIVESLGLEVAEEREADGTRVASLTPVCPLWMQVDMTYGLADTLVWRGRKDEWNAGAHLKALLEKQAEEQAEEDSTPEPLAACAPEGDDAEDAFDLDYIRTMNFFNTARGATEAVGGAFSMPNASIRVLPIKADFAKLNRFVSEYLHVEKHMRFEAWGDFVYLIICDFDQMNSDLNAVAKRRAREINLAVPVKCYDWFEEEDFAGEAPNDPHRMYNSAGRNLVTTGFVSAFSYVDDTGTAITASEVAGIPTMGSQIKSPENDWLSLDLSKDRAKRDILDMTAQVLPALMSGAQAQERSIIQLHSHTPPQTAVHETQHESVNKWVSTLVEDLHDKTLQKNEFDGLKIGQGFVLQLLGGDLPINQFSLKQFRDSRFTENACYQGLIQRRHIIQKLIDMRELEEPLHVSITDYPTQPVTEILGLKPKFSYPGPDRIVRVFETLRPFSIAADLVREAGNTLYERIGAAHWKRVDGVEQLFGWRKSNKEDAMRVVGNADRYDAETPVELRYRCRLPDRKRPFNLQSRKMSKEFLQGSFKQHLETGDVSELAIRERNLSGKVSVLTDPDLFEVITSGEALDIAAFNAQVKQAGRAQEFCQAEAAAEISVISPATIADSVLSRQWGLAPGSPRRHYTKPDFCVPAQTVPNQFTDVLFPRPERLHGYWPLSEKFFKTEVNRRAAEVLSFRSELITYIGSVGAFSGMKVLLNGTAEKGAEVDLHRQIGKMRDLLMPSECPGFDAVAEEVRSSSEEIPQKYAKIFHGFANAILPEDFQIRITASEHGLLNHIMDHSTLVTAEEWVRVEAALPRLAKAASNLLGEDADFEEGMQMMSDTFMDRVTHNKEEMAMLEAAMGGDIRHGKYYLAEPDRLLSARLSQLVTGGAVLAD